MNMNTVFIRAAIATAFVGFGIAAMHVPHAAAAQDVVSMSVDARAPLQVTLLPTLSVVADANRPEAPGTARIASDEPLSVTLMPTVYVSAHAPALAAMLPRVDPTRVVAVDAAPSGLPHIDVERANTAAALRARVMPR
ncbi:MAG: hypothetical protein ABIQ70_00345 [Dokdonella sp.]